MANERTSMLVLKDQAGNYFLVPREMLERGRVPDEHKTELEQLLAEQEDTQGYSWSCGYTIRDVFGVWCIEAKYPPGVRTDAAR